MKTQLENLKSRSIIETALAFGVTADQVLRQYQSNVRSLEFLHNKAITTGKKVNGFTADQLSHSINLFKNKIKDFSEK